MKYSVIIPMYNVRDYIVACVDSILKQLPQDSEIIVVDDGSTDGSHEILSGHIQELNAANIVKILHKENSGASASRNLGIEHAQGDYILFMDSDDVMISDAFASVDESIRMSNSDLYVFSLKKNICGNIVESELTSIQSFRLANANSVDLIQAYLKQTDSIITWQPWSKVFKRKIITMNGIKFDNNLYCCNDFNFFFKYFLHAHSVSFCNTPVTIYTMDRPGRISQTKAQKRFDSMLNAYSNAFSDIELYANMHSSKYKNEVLEYMSYLYICSFDLASILDKKTIKNSISNIAIHRRIYTYSMSRWDIIKRAFYWIFGYKRGAVVLQKIRDYAVSHNYVKSLSDI